MILRRTTVLPFLVAATAGAQSIYIDFGTPGGIPDATYGALEAPGAWSTLTFPAGGMTVDYPALILASGEASSVSLSIQPSAGVLRTCEECTVPPSMPSLHRPLFGDDLSVGFLGDIFTASITTMTFTGLSPGRYRVTLFGIPATVNGGNGWRAWVQGDEAGTTRSLHFPIALAGVFPPFEEGVTHVRFEGVAAPAGVLSIGFRWSHVPVQPGDAFPPIYFDGAFVNGIQLVRLPECPGDVTGDGAVNFADLETLLTAWAQSDPDADLDASGVVDFADLNELLAHWGDAC